MKTVINIIKHAAFVLCILGMALAVCLHSIIIQIFDTSVYNMLGGKLWYMVYVILPLIAVAIPIAAKYFRKCSFAKSVVCAVISIGIYAAVAFGIILAARSYFLDFTPQKWLDYPTERYVMLPDLAREHNLIGMTQSEITALLGEGDEPYATPEDGEYLEYYTGHLSIDSTMLTIVFSDGVAVDAYTYTESRLTGQPLYE